MLLICQHSAHDWKMSYCCRDDTRKSNRLHHQSKLPVSPPSCLCNQIMYCSIPVLFIPNTTVLSTSHSRAFLSKHLLTEKAVTSTSKKECIQVTGTLQREDDPLAIFLAEFSPILHSFFTVHYWCGVIQLRTLYGVIIFPQKNAKHNLFNSRWV
jgi:hypothetical protein